MWVVHGCSLESRPAVHELPSAASRATASGRWVEARHLRAGDTLRHGCGSTATLASVASRRETSKWVYNLEVSRTHTYTIGTSTVLVHNACKGLGNAGANRADSIAKGIPEREIGPSGLPKRYVVQDATKKEAKDAARQAGNEAPINHPSPAVGGPHYHPVKDGVKQRVHHEYPNSQR